MGGSYAGGVVLVEAVRSGFVESVHRGSVVVLVAGTGADAYDTRLMTGIPGLLAKSGAEGVIAVPGVGAVAAKIDDGAPRARIPLLISALRRLSDGGGTRLDAPILDELAELPLYGGGEIVGSVRARW